MDVQLPDGRILRGVPEGTTKEQLAEKLRANGIDVPKEWMAPRRFAGRSMDVMADGSLVPTESVHYSGSGVYSADSGIAERERKYGTNPGFDWKIRPEDVRDVKKSLASPVRGVIKGVNSIPTMAADAGVATRNLITGSNYELPSSMYEREVYDRYLPQHDLPSARAMEFGASLAGGVKIPAPQVRNPVPANFAANARQSAKDGLLAKAQQEGYVVPPSANNPSVMNRILEGIAGKLKVGQEAAVRNQPVTDKLAARALGQNTDAPLTQGALQVIRNEAHAAGYEPVKAAGEIVTDEKFVNQLAKITQTGANAARSFPGLKAPSPIDSVVESLVQPKFDAGDGIDAIRYLRGLSDDAYGAGNKSLGAQYKDASKAVEDMIERHLSSQGENGAGMLKAFRDARKLMAQTFTAGKALVDDVGSSNARSYASQLLSGKPLVGDQRTIGQFASTFGKYAPKPTGETFPALSPLDVYGAAATSAAAGNPLPLMYPFTRTGLREYLLSPAGQQRAFATNPLPRESMGGYGAMMPLGPELERLLGQ